MGTKFGDISGQDENNPWEENDRICVIDIPVLIWNLPFYARHNLLVKQTLCGSMASKYSFQPIIFTIFGGNEARCVYTLG